VNEVSTFNPPATFRAHTQIDSLESYQTMYAESINDPQSFWGHHAHNLQWIRLPNEVYTHSAPGEMTWFTGGQINVSENCVDRHAIKTPNKTAIIWAKNEPGQYEHITYSDLRTRVGRMANVLKAHGVERGDRVCIYLPMIPELAVTMLACARIGAVHSVVFAGFSAEALRDRVVDAHAKVLVTSNVGLRGEKTIGLKSIVDSAVDGLDFVNSVLVTKRTNESCPWFEERDYDLNHELKKQRSVCPAAPMASEDPLFVLYTSGSTGKPKGLVHTTAGYLLWTATTHKYVFDIGDDDIHFCAADCGWITGHSYIVYGPLANGCTTVMFESVPTWPDAGRYWQVVDDIKATTLYTAPTALRALMRAGDEPVKRSSRASLRILGSVGEPINPEVWKWYFDTVGESRCPIVDTWWQTETGGTMITPLPGATPTKPGSATLPFFGIRPVLVDRDGHRIEGNDVEGLLCIEGTWPGQARTIYGDHERFINTYYATYPGLYFTGDGARRDEHGYYWITGRVDDVINVSGHRMGTAEVESAIVAHDSVVECAVVPMPHEIKGQGITVFAICAQNVEVTQEELQQALKQQVRTAIGPIATPDRILFVPGLPKTRSGKIMRRILRKLAAGDVSNLGDLSTLADPSVVDAIKTITLS
jgi:acetyl-CoA synthetase